MRTAGLGIVALVPLMLGTAPAVAKGPAGIMVTLCDGGSMVIPVNGDGLPPPAPCDTKGCHAGCSRKRGLI